MKTKKKPRAAQLKKAQRRKAEAAGKAIGKEVLLQAIKDQVDEQQKAYISEINNALKQVSQLGITALQNTQHLAASHEDLNSQFAVLIRLFISRMNQVIALQNRIYELACADQSTPPDHKVDLIGYDEVGMLFKLFDEFKKRPDYQDHFRTWYTGGDLSQLPPPPEPPAKEEAEEDLGAPREDAEVFGGDYGSQNGNGAEDAEAERAEASSEAQDPLPELRGEEDGGEDDPGNQVEGDVVPEVRP